LYLHFEQNFEFLFLVEITQGFLKKRGIFFVFSGTKKKFKILSDANVDTSLLVKPVQKFLKFIENWLRNRPIKILHAV